MHKLFNIGQLRLARGVPPELIRAASEEEPVASISGSIPAGAIRLTMSSTSFSLPMTEPGDGNLVGQNGEETQ